MILIGCDYHPSWQQVCWVDTATGETKEKKLDHASGEAQRFYRQLPPPALWPRKGQGPAFLLPKRREARVLRRVRNRLARYDRPVQNGRDGRPADPSRSVGALDRSGRGKMPQLLAWLGSVEYIAGWDGKSRVRLTDEEHINKVAGQTIIRVAGGAEARPYTRKEEAGEKVKARATVPDKVGAGGINSLSATKSKSERRAPSAKAASSRRTPRAPA